MNGIADREGYIIIDVGGDDEGAKALGADTERAFEKIRHADAVRYQSLQVSHKRTCRGFTAYV